MVVSARLIVGSIRSAISSITGVLDRIDVPKSPRSSWPIQVDELHEERIVEPQRGRGSRSSCAGVAVSPAMIAAGSPGVRRSSRKTKSATNPITGIVARMRLRM